jgi:hypothetical protein
MNRINVNCSLYRSFELWFNILLRPLYNTEAWWIGMTVKLKIEGNLSISQNKIDIRKRLNYE